MKKEVIAKGKLKNQLRWEVYEEKKLVVLRLYARESLKEGESKIYEIDEAPWESSILEAVNCLSKETSAICSDLDKKEKSGAICPKIDSFTLNYGGASSEKHVFFPEGVTSVAKYTFYGYKTLKTLTLPKSLKWVCEYSFDKCNDFDGVYISDLTAWCKMVFDYVNPLRWGRNLYLNGALVEDLVIPEGLAFLPNYAFAGCESIKSVKFSEPVKWIGNSAFSGCKNLKEIIIPEGVTQIGRYAFDGCSSLERVVFPSTLTDVAEYAFNGCVNVKTLEFSGKPPFLRSDIFRDAKDLNKVITSYGEFESYYDIFSVDGVCNKECNEKMRKLCALLRGDESPFGGFTVCSHPKLYLGEWAGKRAYVFQMQGERTTCYEESARPYSETSNVDYWIYLPDGVSDEDAYDYAVKHPKEWKRYIDVETRYDI